MSTTAHSLHRELPHADDELMTMKEVATLVRVPEATPRYWRHLGTGPLGVQAGRSVRYWRNDAVHWLEEQSRDPQAGN